MRLETTQGNTQYFSSGTQLLGMSGSPVFNGCGFVGIAVQFQMRPVNSSNYYPTGVGIIPVADLLALIRNPVSMAFAVPPYLLSSASVIRIPRKSYC